MQIGFSMIGDWKGWYNRIRALNPDIAASALWGQEKAAKKMEQIVKDHIRNQDIPGWEPLTSQTIKRKSRNEIFLDTELYYSSIKAYRKGFVYHVGIKRGVTTNQTGVELARVAMIHEVKSFHGGPYRPLWDPSYQDMGGANGIRKIVKDVIMNKLLKRGWRITLK